MQNRVTLPQWLDDLIFKELKAQYCPRYSDMTNIDDDKEKTLNYLGTYFPRSYAESYCIFSEYFKSNHSVFADREKLSILDFGCGTGGEVFGLLTALNELRPNLKTVTVKVFDGNQNALRLFEKLFVKFKKHIDFQIEKQPTPFHIDDFYDLSILDNIITNTYDVVTSFKAICEFVTKDQFERKNAYEHITKFLLPKLVDDGLMLLVDVTTYNDTSQEWLPNMMDKGLKESICKIVAKNNGYNQTYTITHSQKSNDISKVAWRLIKK